MKALVLRLRQDSMFWLSCILFLSVVVWVQPWHHERPSLRDQLGVEAENSAYVIIRLYPGSVHSREFLP